MSTDFLQIAGKTFVVFGVANRKSVAWHIARTLEEQGARVIYSVRSEARKKSLETLLAGKPVFICDVEHEGAPARLAAEIAAAGHAPIHGIVHSIAFANYSEGLKPFDETKRADFLQAVTISAFSLVEIARAFKQHLASDASVVTIGISSLLVTPDNYGYMGPIKASLESASRFLAKSFSADPATREVRFNIVGAGPLKTSASAGIPGYIESYLYSEKLTLRKRNLATQEVADSAVFLLSPRASGINATTLTIDAGLGGNFYDAEIIKLAMRPEPPVGAGGNSKFQ
ncbi:enoyl-ACP reductase FabI [Ereboglobus luteus]|uniref:Enoyl-[acyl-carrier-protein] reductase [NADH] n=1 Tax=Ereboglobus luteus TaxID=1796921 RepID=A0A2U8E5B3_9BACT|nr:SDR family oxidoreductase [Ereboglobus luteus]AWI09744.1 enoyl-ACP reductase [Ereboglobus luteus]